MIRRLRLFRRPAPPAPPAAPPPPPPEDALGDAARDRRLWDDAARHYRAHLAAHPADAGIQVQLGHVLKEGGDLAGAERAYRRAMALRPEDHDAPLQLGHALKLQHRLDEARAAYRLSDSLAPVNHAAVELLALGDAPLHPPRAPAPPAQPDRAGCEDAFRRDPTRRHWLRMREAGGNAASPGEPGGATLLDLTDLLAMLRTAGRATGIQRVQLGLARHLLRRDAAGCRFVALDGPFGPFWHLHHPDVLAILDHCEGEAHDPVRAHALVEAALDRAGPLHRASARVLVLAGAFWFLAGAPALLDALRRAGIRVGIVAFDLIPLTHPEHADAGTVARFRQALDEGAARWDFVLAISEHTAAAMRRALAARGAAAVPVRAVPLAHRFCEAPPAGWPAALADWRGRPFALCVGTIESRKNHAALFQAWKLLVEDGFEPPPLAWVGRPGWRVGDLLAQLEATGGLGGRIRVVHGVSDPELAALYREAAFTLFPSWTEGWGLPVGESLALGTPCLASLAGAVPEAAAGFATPLDPFSPRGIAEAVQRWTEHPAALEAERARIASGFRPRDWEAVGEDFLARLRECLAAAPARAAPPLPAPGPDGALDLAAMLGPGFLPAEDGACWASASAATLHLDLPPGRLLLTLAARPGSEGGEVSLGADPPVPLRDGAVLALDWPGGAGEAALHLGGPARLLGGAGAPPVRFGLRRAAWRPPGAAALPRGTRLGPEDREAWAALAGGDGTLRFRPDAPPGAIIHLLLGLRGEDAPRRLRLEVPPGGVVSVALAGGWPAPLFALLLWAADDDLEGRLALLEAAPPPLPIPERLRALEAGPAPAPPPGEARRWALRLR